MRDGALGVGSFEVKAEGSAVRGEAQAALQAGVRLHGGVACPELVCEPFVELLIAAGADVNAKNIAGKTPLDRAVKFNVTPETAALLRKHGGKTSEELKAEGK